THAALARRSCFLPSWNASEGIHLWRRLRPPHACGSCGCTMIEAPVMETNTPLRQAAMTPAILRVTVARLLNWLPSRPVSLLGDEVPALARALRRAGVNVTTDGDGSAAAATVLVMAHASASPATEVQRLLTGVAGPVCLVVLGDAAAQIDRATWEHALIKAEWRKHPLNERVAPYGE